MTTVEFQLAGKRGDLWKMAFNPREIVYITPCSEVSTSVVTSRGESFEVEGNFDLVSQKIDLAMQP